MIYLKKRGLRMIDISKKIDGMDMEKACAYFDGDLEILEEILNVCYDDGFNKLMRLKSAFKSKNWHNYEIEAHSIKSSMATLFVTELSAHAKKHEFAVKENNIEYIEQDADSLACEFEAFLSSLGEFLNK